MNMRKTVAAILSAIAAVHFAGGASVSPKVPETEMAKALAPFVESGELPGVVSVLHKDGKDVVTCIGYADVAAKRPITVDDMYMQCSQTKGFCGVTVAILVEEGKISLDDPVSKYLPEFANLTVKVSSTNGETVIRKAANKLTVRMVMNHTGGFAFELPNFHAMGGWSRRMPLRSVAAMAAAIPLNFEPGTKVQYSNVGIDIGAAVVEVVTGKRWEAFLKERVLDPLGMVNTTFWPTAEQLARKIELHNYVKGGPAKFREQNPAMQRPYGDDRVFASAGAGLWTCVRDQLKFYKMLMNLGIGENGARILKEETVKSILAVTTRPKGMGGYSLGLSAPETDSDDAWFGHGGAWATNCSVNWHRRQLRLWVVQLCGCKWDTTPCKKVENAFFSAKADSSGVDAHTGRMK